MSNSRDNRAASREQRRHLQILANRHDRIRSRSPSPAPEATSSRQPSPKRSAREIEDDQFQDALNFSMATPAQLAAIRDELRNEIRNEFRAEAAAAAAGIPDAIRRKPEIPAFDKSHIDIWIRRTEHAYTRAGITAVGDKFAWLETKFPVGADPNIDEFLYGTATQAEWTNFLAYLRKEYGKTKQQKAAIILDGLKRDGRRPSQYIATLDDKTKDVTIDDLKKEMLLREMPADIRRMLQERIENVTAKEAAKIADSYFDADGKPKHGTGASTVSAVTEQLQDVEIDENNINAIGRRTLPRQNRNFPQRRAPTFNSPRPDRTAPTPRFQPAKRETNPRNPQKNVNLCQCHFKFGDAARYCEVGCSRFDENRFPGNGQARRT